MKKILSVLLFIICVFCYMTVYALSSQGEIADGLVRLHILANSDSEADQNIKLAVRDYISEKLAGEKFTNSWEYAKKAEELANEYLAKENIGYYAAATAERVFIPKKSYKNVTLPSGSYKAIRVLLGNGEGENWWCVAYPALCFSEAKEGEISETAKKMLKEHLSEENYSLITEKPKYKFYIVDAVCKLWNKK